MHKTWWLLLLFLLAGCEEETSKAKAAAAADAKPIFLWEAKHETGTAYLFGTIHLPDPRVLKLPRVVREAFDRSDIVLTEIELDAATQVKMLRAMQLPRGESLKKILPEDVQKRIAKLLPMAAVEKQKVWAVTVNLMLLQAGDLFRSGRLPLDADLPLKAKAAGKTVGALETVEEQIGLFDKMTIEDQIEMLKDTLDLIEKDKASGTNTLHKLVDLYLAGDLEAIMKFETTMGRKPSERDKKFMKLLLDDRNVRMADRLAARMKKDPGHIWFVAVGAAHYHGEVGVGSLLAKKGFKVRRLTRADAVKQPAGAG